MTTTGSNRAAYAALMADTDPRPSRFSHEYVDWAERADMWAEYNRMTVTTWADGLGNWHARIPAGVASPRKLAQRAITRELEARAPRHGLGGYVPALARVAVNADGSSEWVEV